MSPAAFAPQEILERIFRHAATGTLDVPSKSWRLRGYPNNDASKAIGQVPLVNRHWNEPATRILYWQLVLNEGDEDTPAASPKDALLRRTLEQSPRLQAHVRSLRLNTWTGDINKGEKLKWSNLRILRCCTLLQHLWIFGWIPSLLNQFHTTIATFTGLRYLSIRSYKNDRIIFCSFKELEAMMRGWPNLERLNIQGRVVTDNGGESVRSTQSPPIPKHVTRLILYGPSPLEGFTLIIPNLAELSLSMGDDPTLFLLHAQRWNRTLRCLKLWTRRAITETQWSAVMMAICGFERLQILSIQGSFPLALLELPDTLEEFTFMVRSGGLPVLFDVLDQKLPRPIRKVKFEASYPYRSLKTQHDLESALQVFCDKRKWKWRVHDYHVYLITSS